MSVTVRVNLNVEADELRPELVELGEGDLSSLSKHEWDVLKTYALPSDGAGYVRGLCLNEATPTAVLDEIRRQCRRDASDESA